MSINTSKFLDCTEEIPDEEEFLNLNGSKYRRMESNHENALAWSCMRNQNSCHGMVITTDGNEIIGKRSCVHLKILRNVKEWRFPETDLVPASVAAKKITKPKSTVAKISNPGFEAGCVDGITFTPHGEGVFFGKMTETDYAEMIKLLPGSSTKLLFARVFTTCTVVKGLIEFEIEGDSHNPGLLAHLQIKEGKRFKMKNNSHDEALIILL